MGKLVCFILLIICTILTQGIVSLSDKNATDSFASLVRKKRVIDRSPTRNRRPQLQDVPYIVNIFLNGLRHCSGSILSARVVLTAAHCVGGPVRYHVVAGTVLRRHAGTTHLVNGILRHPDFIPQTFANDIALLSILEPIILGPGFNRAIQIYQSHDGHLPPRTLVTTSGWGVVSENDRRRFIRPDELRSISLRTISLEECRNRHPFTNLITDELICTHDSERRCAAEDDGNPLVFGEYLVGVLAWYGDRPDHPDVFVNVAIPAHRNWIMTHMNHIPSIPLMPMVSYNPARGAAERSLRKSSKVHFSHE